MKLKTFIITLLIILAIIFISSKINFKPNFVDFFIDEKFYENYSPETVMPENYKSIVKFENENGKTFPRTIPKKIILYSNYGFLKSKYELDKDESKQLLKILNDSASYQWGELGTPEVHYYFKYLDDNNNLIGFTTIDQEGMAYSKPYLGKMKWCGMRKINEINSLINEIEK